MRIKKIKTTFKICCITLLIIASAGKLAFSHSDPKKADVCLLEQGKYTLTGTPCDTKTEGGKTKFEIAPGASITLDVVAQMGTDAGLEATGFTLNLTFTGIETAPTCSPPPQGKADPDGKFDTPIGTCSPTKTELPSYSGAALNVPNVKTNFVIGRIVFSTTGLSNNAIFSVGKGTELSIGNPTGDNVLGIFIPAEVTVKAAPCSTNPPTAFTLSSKPKGACTQTTGNATVTLAYTAPTGCTENSQPKTCTISGIDVYRGGTKNTGTKITPNANKEDPTDQTIGTKVSYYIYANSGGACDQSTGVSAEITPTCGQPPSITTPTITTNKPYKSGEAISISGTVTDSDSTITAIKVTLYYGTTSLTAAAYVNPQSNGSFIVNIPSTAVIANTDLYWAVVAEDELGLLDNTKSVYPIGFDKTNPSLSKAAKIPATDIITGYAPTFPTVTQSPSGRIYKGQTVTITGTISDQDTSDKTKIKLTLYYGFGKNFTASRFENGGFGREAGKTTTAYPLSNGNFTFTIPGSDINPTGDNFYWGVAAEDDKNLKSYYPAGWSPTSADPTVGASVVSKNDIIIGTMLGFIPNKEPYPSEFPFRPTPTNKELRVEFEVNDRANVTMRIYSMDGTLIRIVSDPQSGGDTTTPTKLDLNQCKYNFGCSWDGRNYSGFLVANGMYMMNLYITGTGDTFKGQRIDYTKGIVIMK